MTTKTEQLETAVRADKLRLLAKANCWTFDQTLRAFTAVVFWSGRRRRAQAIAWLKELLVDLEATQNNANLPEADNAFEEFPS